MSNQDKLNRAQEAYDHMTDPDAEAMAKEMYSESEEIEQESEKIKKVHVMMIKNAEIKQAKVSGRYYLSLEISYHYGIDFVFVEVFAFGNFEDYQEDPQIKSNLIWDITMNRFEALGLSFNPYRNTKELIGCTFKGIVTYKYDPEIGHVVSKLIAVKE